MKASLLEEKKDTEHMENQKSGDLSLDLAFLFADPSLDFSFLKHKMQGLKISALNVPIFSIYLPQSTVVLKDEQTEELNQG